MAEERRTVEDSLARMSAARKRGKSAVASYWYEEAQRTRMLELALVPTTEERRAGRGGIVDLFSDAAAIR